MSEHPEVEEHRVKRDGWPAGPWDDEPDKVLWKHAGFDCMIVRNQMGTLCGYVGVTEGHPWFDKDYSDVAATCHGGLTYADYCQGHICHPSDVRTYWLGFDCGHLYDLVPAIEARLSELQFGNIYRDLAYVTKQVNQLAKQAKSAR